MCIAVAALLIIATLPARAAETRTGENVVIGPNEVVHGDLYVGATTVRVDGTIDGDLVAAGSVITVNGTVTGDVLAAGQAVVINGVVEDDVRAGGQAIMLGPNARVAGDLAVGGLSLENQPGSVVAGDVLVGGYQALLSGAVGQRVLGGLDRLELRGTVGGDMNVAVSGENNGAAMQFSPAAQVPIPGVPPNLTIADQARIGGKLSYRSTTDASISPSAQVGGGVAFERIAPASAPTQAPQALWLGLVRRLAGLTLVGLLLLWLAPAWTKRLADTVEQRPLPSLAWGALAYVVMIAAIVSVLFVMVVLAVLFGMLTLGGLAGMAVGAGLVGIATLVLSYIGFTMYIAQGLVAFEAGRWLLRRFQPAWAEQPVIPLVVGLVLYVLLSAIPWVGTLVGIAVVLLALGALWIWGQVTFNRARPTSAPMVGLQPA